MKPHHAKANYHQTEYYRHAAESVRHQTEVVRHTIKSEEHLADAKRIAEEVMAIEDETLKYQGIRH